MKDDETEMAIRICAVDSLKSLTKTFKKANLNDREATLSLYYFLNFFCEVAWKDNKASEVLKSASEVAEMVEAKKK